MPLWTLEHYINPSGVCPACDFLNGQVRGRSPKAYLQYHGVLLLTVLAVGPAIGRPYWDHLAGKIGELRWKCERVQYRLFCATHHDRRLVALGGAVKQKGTIWKDNRKVIMDRYAEYCTADYDPEARFYRFRDRYKGTADDHI